jgi:anti-sigma factor RsiW
MAHDNYHLMMSMALDGALSAQEDAQLREHLEVCPVCQDVWNRMCLADHVFSQAASAEPPATLAAGVMARVANYEAERRESKPWRLALGVILGLFAALVGLGFVGIMLLGAGNIADGVAAAVVQGRSVIESLGVAAAVVETLASALAAWLQYLVGQPGVWAAAISALTLASIWIGLLEVLKPAPVPAVVQGS